MTTISSLIYLKAASRLVAYDSQWSDKTQRDIERKYQGQQKPKQLTDNKIFKMQPSALASQLRNIYKDDFKGAMGSLTYYCNRAGKNLLSTDKDRLEKAKDALRKLYGKDKDSSTPTSTSTTNK